MFDNYQQTFLTRNLNRQLLIVINDQSTPPLSSSLFIIDKVAFVSPS